MKVESVPAPLLLIGKVQPVGHIFSIACTIAYQYAEEERIRRRFEAYCEQRNRKRSAEGILLSFLFFPPQDAKELAHRLRIP